MDQSLQQFEVRYSDDEIIFCEYEKGDNFYFIKSGKVKLVRQIENKESILDVLNQGVFFGEMAIIEAEPRSATAIAVGKSVVLLKFHRDNFKDVVLKNNAFVLRLFKTFVNRIWFQQQRLHIYQYEETSLRVIATLLNLKVSDGGNKAHVHVSVDDLSKWVGISVSECKKVLQSLTTAKTITVQLTEMSIEDVDALERRMNIGKHLTNQQDK